MIVEPPSVLPPDASFSESPADDRQMHVPEERPESCSSEMDVMNATFCSEQTELPDSFRSESVAGSFGDLLMDDSTSTDAGAQSEGVSPLCNSRASTASAVPPLTSEECVWYAEELRKHFGDAIADTLDLAFSSAHADGPLGQCGSISISQTDLRTLANNRWLNDTVISAYLELIVERSRRMGLERIYAFNTFFYAQMRKRGYDGVKRWFRKVNLFQHEILLVPIHHENHWSMVVVSLNRQIFFYYDSLQFDDQEQADNFTYQYVNAVRKVVEEEAKQKLKILDYCKNFLIVCVNSPVQENVIDCGVFACCYADAFCRHETAFEFQQDKMSNYRLQMMAEIVSGFLFEPPPAPPSEEMSEAEPESAADSLVQQEVHGRMSGSKENHPPADRFAHDRL